MSDELWLDRHSVKTWHELLDDGKLLSGSPNDIIHSDRWLAHFALHCQLLVSFASFLLLFFLAFLGSLCFLFFARDALGD